MKDYDSTKPSKYISYLDKWLKNVDNCDVNLISKCNSIENSSTEYILKVDLEYPDESHVLRNDYPLAPEKLATLYDRLSDYCKKIEGEYGIKVCDVMKLIQNLGGKTNYLLHYRNLQLYLSLGVKLIKIHRVLKFKQSD